jgi:hypothetical protein
MWENIRHSERARHCITGILLALIICLQLLRITTVFESREDFHLDEVWSYGFANSHYDSYLSRLPIWDFDSLADWSSKSSSTQNFNEWESSDVFWEYLTVQSDERFDYASVFMNQRYDLSPPLHTMILHTVSSFFPDTFSWWYAYVINMVAFLVAQIALYFLSRELLKSRWLALLVIILFGFSMGAVNDFIYLRPYALATSLALLFSYLNLRLFQRGFKKCTGTCIALGALTFAGCYTNVYFLLFAFVMAAGTALFLLVHRQWKPLLIFGLPILLGALLMIALSLPMFSALAYSSGLYQKTEGALWRIAFCLSFIFAETLGIAVPEELLSIVYPLVFVSVLTAVTLFISRRRRHPVLMSFDRGSDGKNKGIARVSTRPLSEPRRDRQKDVFPLRVFALILITTCLAVFLFVTATISVQYMGSFVDRYFFIIMPYMCLLALWWVHWLLGVYLSNRNIRLIVVSFLTVVSVIVGSIVAPSVYIFPRDANYDGTIESLTANADVILLIDDDWILNYYPCHLTGADQFFALLATEYNQHDAALAQIENDGPVYLIMPFDSTDGTCYLDHFASQEWAEQVTYIGTEYGYDNEVKNIYRLR